MIRASAVEIRAGGARLLHDVDVAVRPGECVAIVGPNGAGKSTLGRILAGDLAPERGTVTLEGRALSSYAPRELARRVAVMRQQSLLSFPFTVREVVALGRVPHAGVVSRHSDARIVAQAIATVGLRRFADREFTTLSGGERQRTHLARHLAQIWYPVEDGGRYLILDEPTNHLDLGQQHAILETVKGMSRSGVGVLVVLHGLDLARRYADRVVVLDRGRVVDAGPPERVITPELVASVFGVRTTSVQLADGERHVFVSGAR